MDGKHALDNHRQRLPTIAATQQQQQALTSAHHHHCVKMATSQQPGKCSNPPNTKTTSDHHTMRVNDYSSYDNHHHHHHLVTGECGNPPNATTSRTTMTRGLYCPPLIPAGIRRGNSRNSGGIKFAILSIPPLIPAGFRRFWPECRNSVEFQEFRRIPAGINRNTNGIDINSPHILRFYFRNVLEEGN